MISVAEDYLIFTTGGKIWITGIHIDTHIVYMHMYTREQPVELLKQG